MSAKNPPDRFQRELESRIAVIEGLTDALEAWALSRGVPPKVFQGVALILDELFTNIVVHGYADNPAGRIQVEAQVTPGAIRVTLRDQAPAFNPLLVPEPNIALGIEEREIGGLGLLFVRRCADELDYRRLQVPGAPASNQISFSKRLV